MSKVRDKWEATGLLATIPENAKEAVAKAFDDATQYLIDNDLMEHPSEIGKMCLVLIVRWFTISGLLNWLMLIEEWIYRFDSKGLDFWDNGIVEAMINFLEQLKNRSY